MADTAGNSIGRKRLNPSALRGKMMQEKNWL